uniref:Uncharacterized protein n=1 Tax=Coccidioides posadasii RMSCC 3488 TaxID=454284 RepID=A0A0J6F210_COCPO|nr:hypothetical protein CPAG_03267 [Coccidioides posadasii RMSCC 3488]
MKEAGPVHCGNRNRVPFGSLPCHGWWAPPDGPAGRPMGRPFAHAVPSCCREFYIRSTNMTAREVRRRLCCHVVSPDAVKRPFWSTVDNRGGSQKSISVDRHPERP